MTTRCCAGHLPSRSVVRASLERLARKFARWNGDSVRVAVQHVTEAYDIAVAGGQPELPLEENQ